MLGGSKMDGVGIPFVRSGVRRTPKRGRRPPSRDPPAMPMPGMGEEELVLDTDSETENVLQVPRDTDLASTEP